MKLKKNFQKKKNSIVVTLEIVKKKKKDYNLALWSF